MLGGALGTSGEHWGCVVNIGGAWVALGVFGDAGGA